MEFDIPPDKINESASKIINRAIDEAKRRDHSTLTNEHLFLAFIQGEWDLFVEFMRDVELNPHVILQAVEQYLSKINSSPGFQFRASTSVRLTMRLALHHSSRAGKRGIESTDLFHSIFAETKGDSVKILRSHGVNQDTLMSQIDIRMRNIALLDESVRKRFELPPFLRSFATNLNLLARQNKLPLVFGRDNEIQQALEILCHRQRPNSVMLLGEHGVGKTAVVEGLAYQIEFKPDTVPIRLRDCQIVSLQMNAMVAGTMLRGMFEDRIQNVIRELKETPNIIIFIDEAHTIIGAGSAMGASSDAGDVFKSAMARGEVKIIAATTLSEYKQSIQNDEALARRFRCINIGEPTIEQTRNIVYKLRESLERNYSVRILDEAIETALNMSPRYSRNLRLPDKVIGWIDTAAVRSEINKSFVVRSEDIISVISSVARIPEDMVFRNVTARFKNIDKFLQKRVIGQAEAIQAVKRRLILNKGPLKDGFDRPDGVLLFLGPTGVGKTELAKGLTDFLFSDDKKMIRIDMSEYQEGYTSLDKLIGTPRGIIGSEYGGILTNQLRDNPYTVVLLDEIEKASPRLLNVFLQAFDEGWITDGRGKRVYLSDAIIIMTSNLGSRHFKKLTNPMGFASRADINIGQILREVKKDMERTFSPEFINRIDDVIVFAPLTEKEVFKIAKKYLDEIKETLLKEGKTIDIDQNALDKLVKDGHSLAYGARFLKREIDDRIKVPLSEKLSNAKSFRIIIKNNKIEIEENGIGDVLVKQEFEVI